jgi:hypothetical protein
MSKALKYCFVIFTYGDDAHLLGQTLRALKAITPMRRVFVFDDAANPLPYPPHGVHYSQTHFKRNGNLNGTECAEGELFCMYEAAMKVKADVVIKLDSDIILNNMKWLTDGNPLEEQIGFKLRAEQNFCSGACYSLPTEALVKMLRILAKTPRNDFKGESIIMSYLARSAGYYVRLWDCSEKVDSELWRASSINASAVRDGQINSRELLLMKNLDVVYCTLISEQRDKNADLMLMKAYLDSK